MTNHEIPQSPTGALTVSELEAKLSSAGIDISKWGQGSAKTTSHLLKEITEGESVLNLTEDGTERRLGVAGVHVFYEDSAGNVYRLIEDRQEFKDGREPRIRDLETSLSEKLKVGEDPEAAARRAIAEEIGVEVIDSFDFLKYTEKVNNSESFPELRSVYDVYTYAAFLGEDAFNPEGYVEEQPDKVNYYIWVSVTPYG